MPDGGQTYDDTRVFFDGVRVKFDPKQGMFHAYSVTVDGRTLHAILTPHAVLESRRNMDVALQDFFSTKGIIEFRETG